MNQRALQSAMINLSGLLHLLEKQEASFGCFLDHFCFTCTQLYLYFRDRDKDGKEKSKQKEAIQKETDLTNLSYC